ncbi:MAG: enoyl-CoA hydratase/isomerase family protein [Gemmatimonadales bacterium]
MSLTTLTVERTANGVVRLRLNRPEKRNAQTPEMWRELRETGVELIDDRSVRVVLLSGNGPGFSAGIDLGVLLGAATGSGAALPSDVEPIQQAFTWLRDAPFPTIAAVHGFALGAGAQLALACDLRILADDAVMAFPEINFGILPDLGGCVWLPELIGSARAKELIFTGDRFDAHEAHRLGIANRVVPLSQLEAAAESLAATLAAKAPLGIAAAKRAIAASLASTDAGLRESAAGVRRCLASEDFKEAGRAALEKRGPIFHGR